MSSDSSVDNLAEKEDKTQHKQNEFYVLYLYVAGKTIRSRWAIKELRGICNEYLPNRHEIRVVDIFEQPELAESDHVVATPTLIKKLPMPVRQFIGDMSDHESMLFGLDIW
ncbi:MAG: circadian clock KaiB family protein [Limnothrix sp.]